MRTAHASRTRIDLTETYVCSEDPRRQLGEAEIRLLDKHISVRAVTGGYALTAKPRYAGVLRIGHLEYVLPARFSLLTLVRLILLRHGITAQEQTDLAKLSRKFGNDASDLDKVLSALLVLECERISRGHVVQQYLTQRDLLPVARGRPDWMGTALHPGQVDCRFQLKTTDVLVNQLVRAGLEAGRRHLRGEPSFGRRLNSQAFVWADVASPIRPRFHDFDTARSRLNRLGDHYRTALALAQALLFKVDEEHDNKAILSPVSDLAYLFETLVERALVMSRPPGVEVIAQDRSSRAIVNSAGKVYRRTRPDISLVHGGMTRLVIDAKYKPRYVSGGPGLRSHSKVTIADLYQMFFYSERAARRDPSGTPVPVCIVAPLLPGSTPPAPHLLQVHWKDVVATTAPPLTVFPIPVEELTRAVSRSDHTAMLAILQPLLDLVDH